MSHEPAIDRMAMLLLPDGWMVASSVSFDAVVGRLALLAMVVGGLVFLWWIGRDVPKETDMERGLAYFCSLGACGLGALALRGAIGLDLTWSWVAFLAAAISSCAGMMSGYKEVDAENRKRDPSSRPPRVIQTAAVFVIATIAAFLFVWGYFAGLGWLMR